MNNEPHTPRRNRASRYRHQAGGGFGWLKNGNPPGDSERRLAAAPRRARAGPVSVPRCATVVAECTDERAPGPDRSVAFTVRRRRHTLMWRVPSPKCLQKSGRLQTTSADDAQVYFTSQSSDAGRNRRLRLGHDSFRAHHSTRLLLATRAEGTLTVSHLKSNALSELPVQTSRRAAFAF